MEEILENLENVSKCGFCVWDCQAMKAVSKKNTDFSLVKTFENDCTEEEEKVKHNMDIMEDQATR